ncbi:MAG: helix-turn-helix domain-containing protein [Methylocella sp.]|nr:MAG: hypothetical protein DLM68_16545 [Hyphomicrobiales bacterium]
MRAEERDRAFLIRQGSKKQVRPREAAERLGIGQRQIKRRVKRFRQEGDKGLVSRQRGRESQV